MKIDLSIKSAIVALMLVVFAPLAFAADEATEPAGQNQEQGGRDVASKHKGKRKHHRRHKSHKK